MIKPQYHEMYEWNYTDRENDCIIEFHFPGTFNPDCVESKLNNNKTALMVSFAGNPPIVCGALFGTASGIEISLKEQTYSIVITKNQNEKWPILIKMVHPDYQTIDPKSAFICYQELCSLPDDKTSQNLAIQFLEKSANAGYLNALQILGQIYLNTEDHYAEGAVLLKHGADKYKDPICCYHIGLVCVSHIDEIDAGIQYLTRSAEGGYGMANFTLGQIYSPISNIKYEHKDGAKAMQYFKSVPEENITPALLTEMAQFYEQGIGVEKDEKKAEELRGKANEMIQKMLETAKANHQILSADDQQDISEQNTPKTSTSQTIFMVGAISAFVAGFGYMVYRRFTK